MTKYEGDFRLAAIVNDMGSLKEVDHTFCGFANFRDSVHDLLVTYPSANIVVRTYRNPMNQEQTINGGNYEVFSTLDPVVQEVRNKLHVVNAEEQIEVKKA